MAYFDETTHASQAQGLSEFRPTPFQECLILASRGDSLGALIKSQALDRISRNQIINFFSLPEKQLFSTLSKIEAELIIRFREEAHVVTALEADSLISDAIASFPTWAIRRKARNVQRRLLVAYLCKHANYSPNALKGAKYGLLVNLAKAKGLI